MITGIKKLAGTLILGLVIVSAPAQDAIFSLHQPAPVHLNPAFCGVFPDQYRFSLQYKDQARSYLRKNNYRDLLFNAEMRLNGPGSDYLAFGLQADNSTAGASVYSASHLLGGFSYIKKLHGNLYRGSAQYLSMGIQFGPGQQKVSAEGLLFPEQYNLQTGEFDPESQGEPILEARHFWDMHAGLAWYYVMGERFSVTAGISVYHLNEPVISLVLNSQSQLSRRWTGMLHSSWPLGNQLSIQPALIYHQQQFHQTALLGNQVSFNSHEQDDMAISIAGWTQIGTHESDPALNAIILTAGLQLNAFSFGISLSFPTSTLKRVDDGIGAMEFSMVYRTGRLDKGKRLVCPGL